MDTSDSPYAKLRPVPIEEVELKHGFWAKRLEKLREVTIPSQYELLENTGRRAREGYVANSDWGQDCLYRAFSPAKTWKTEFLAIPYYAWANRDPSLMSVWIRSIPKLDSVQR